MGALVVVAHRGLVSLYPGDAFVRLGVPVLLVAFPLDAVWYVTRDALSPLLGGLGFFLALRLARRPDSPLGWFVAAGGVAALGALAKSTNVVLLGLCGLAALLVWRSHAAGRAPRLAALAAAALLPVAAWAGRNALVLGDPTASAWKAARLGWTPRPAGELFAHPLFTPSGLWEYLASLAPSFWRGELVWYREVLAVPWVDAFYAISTALLLTLAAVGVAREREPRDARLGEVFALAAVGASVAVLMVLSLRYLFPETGNPSSARPWFDHGRLISGALVPFLLLYVRGLQRATAPLGAPHAARAAWLGLAAVAVLAVGSELWLTGPVLRSEYNWYHLP